MNRCNCRLLVRGRATHVGVKMESPGRLGNRAYAVLVSRFSLLPNFMCLHALQSPPFSILVVVCFVRLGVCGSPACCLTLFTLCFLTVTSPDMPGFSSLNSKNGDKGEVVSFKNKLVPFLSLRLAEYRRWCWQFEAWFARTTRNKNVLLFKIFLVLF